MLKIASLLLRKNGIPFDKEELSFQIQSHPSFPSLHAITGVLDHFNIENVAAKVPNTQEVLNQLPNYFIAHVNDEQGPDLFFYEKKGDLSCKLYDGGGKSKSMTSDEFLKNFTGIIVAVEKDENNTEKTHKKSVPINALGLTLFSISALVIFSLSTNEISNYFTLLFGLAGTLISISILRQEFGIKDAIGDAFCSSDSEKKDCNAVLSSKGAKLFKNYKLSDLSLVYFLGLLTSIFLLLIQGYNLSLIYIINILAIPITLYSIYYQAIKVKPWCLLCLSIVGVLWILAAIPFLFEAFAFTIDFQIIETLTVLIGFLASFSIWSYLKPQFIEASENKKYKLDYYKFKRKYSLFSTLLKNEPALDTQITNTNEIVFGNKKSRLEILIVTNPFCGHCRPVHTIIEDILTQFNNEVKVCIRFNINLKNLESDVVKITTTLMNIYKTKGEKTSLLAMDEAYNKLAPKDWLTKWSKEGIDFASYIETLHNQKDWCNENKINFTPEILINGYSYPKEYDRPDLLFFIEELHEEYNKELIISETVNNEVS